MAIKSTWSYGQYKTKITGPTPEEVWSYGRYGYFWEEVAGGAGPVITQLMVGR